MSGNDDQLKYTENQIKISLNELVKGSQIGRIAAMQPMPEVTTANHQFGFKLNDVSRYVVTQNPETEVLTITFIDGNQIHLYEQNCQYFRDTINLLQGYLLSQTSIHFPTANYDDNDGYEEIDDDDD